MAANSSSAVAFRNVHITDFHQETEKLEVVQRFIREKNRANDGSYKIHALTITGDMIGSKYGDPTEDAAIKSYISNLQHLHEDEDMQAKVNSLVDYAKKEQNGTLSPKEELNVETILSEITEAQTQAFHDAFEGEYQKVADILERVNEDLEDDHVIGGLGNWDTKHAYKVLSPYMKFVENEKKVILKGEKGLEMVVQGDINTNTTEDPIHMMKARFARSKSPTQELLALNQAYTLLSDYFVDSSSGWRIKDLDQRINAATTENTKKGYQNIQEQALKHQANARERLGEVGKADIWMSHKTPHASETYVKPNGLGSSSSGDITMEYSQGAKAILGGHVHHQQIGTMPYATLQQKIKNSTETTMIDGHEVKVIYKDPDQPWEINPGPKHFAVEEYDENKDITQVVMYEFVYEDIANEAPSNRKAA